MSHPIPELLAPAGSRDAFRAAVHNGADAVYFGAPQFNARARADNFNEADMAEAIAYGHARSVRSYLTLNTLVTDTECPEALEVADRAATLGIDALIIQDVGLAVQIRRRWPDLPLYASTQMSIGNEAGMRKAKDLGLDRVVLPRELPETRIRELAAYAASIGLETEVFIHGALCVSYSGQCLLSAVQGGRSANRGACAQPCRLPYRLIRPDGTRSDPFPFLSLKDMSLYAHVEPLADAGVTSLKIEGRLRSPEYVGTVVGAYRSRLDGHPDPMDADRLLQVFNRGGVFTDGYFTNNRDQEMGSGIQSGRTGIQIGRVALVQPEGGWLYVEPDEEVRAARSVGRGDVLVIHGDGHEPASAPAGTVETMRNGVRIRGFHPDVLRTIQVGDTVYRMSDAENDRAVLRSNRRKTRAHLTLSSIGPEHYRLSATCTVPGMGRTPKPLAVVFSAKASADRDTPLATDRIVKQLKRTGNTPFSAESVAVDAPSVQLSVAALNALRRGVLSGLEETITGRYLRTVPEDLPECVSNGEPDEKSTGPRIAVQYWTEPVGPAGCGADTYLFPQSLLADLDVPPFIHELRVDEPDCGIAAVLPPALPESDLEPLRNGPYDIASRTLDLYSFADGNKRILEPGGNVTSTGSLFVHLESGADRVCLSHEVDPAEWPRFLQAVGSSGRVELPVYGRIGVMHTFRCIVGQNRCNPASGPCRSGLWYLEDGKGGTLPLIGHPGPCTMDILSARPENHLDVLRSLAERHPDLLARAVLRLIFFDESPEERRRLVQTCRNILRNTGINQDPERKPT